MLTAFVEFVENKQNPGLNHYIAYRMVNNVWLKFDDESIYLLEGLEDEYNAEFYFYRNAESTTPAILPMSIPEWPPLDPSSTYQKEYMTTTSKYCHM